MHWHGISGLVGRANRLCGNRFVSVDFIGRQLYHDLSHQRNPVRNHPFGVGRTGAGEHPRRRGGDFPLCGACVGVWLRCGLAAVLECGAHWLSLGGRRSDGACPAVDGTGNAFRGIVYGAVRVLYSLRSGDQTGGGAFTGAAAVHRIDGGVSAVFPGGRCGAGLRCRDLGRNDCRRGFILPHAVRIPARCADP